MKKKPRAVLYPDGTAMYLDDKRNEIEYFNKWGWKGLHYFLKYFPNGVIKIRGCKSVKKEFFHILLESIFEPPIKICCSLHRYKSFEECALEIKKEFGHVSTTSLQRKCKINHQKAKEIVEKLK